MKEFSNKFGQKYKIEITAGSPRKKLLARFDFDLLEPERDAEKIFEAIRSTTKMMDLIWCLIEDQLPGKAEKNEDAFWDLFDAQQLAQAISAAREEIDFFIQTLQPNTGLPAKLRKAAKVEEVARQHLEKFLVSDEVENLLTEEFESRASRAVSDLRKSLLTNDLSTKLLDTLVQT